MSRRRSIRLKEMTAPVVLPDEIACLDKELVTLTPDEDCMGCDSQRTDETASVQSFSSSGSAKHEEENFDIKTDPIFDVDTVVDIADQELLGDDLSKPTAVPKLPGDDLFKPTANQELLGDGLSKPTADQVLLEDDLSKPTTDQVLPGDDLSKPTFDQEFLGDDLLKPTFDQELLGDVLSMPMSPINAKSDALVPEVTLVKEDNLDVEDAVVPDLILTDKMITEEEQMHKETVKESNEEKQERDKLWDHMDEGTRETHYNRLKFLLSKSNMYTEYLIARMRRQEEESKKKEQRDAKRQKRKPDKDDGHEIRSSKRQKVEVADKPASKKFIGKRSKKIIQSDDNLDSQESESSSIGNCNKENLSENTVDINSVDEQETEKEEHSRIENQEMLAEDLNDDLIKIRKTVNGEKVLPGQPVLLSGGVLRDYQIDGYKWLKVLYENGVNGILADEMGLGKTVQCIALISHLMNMGVSGPYLVCAPLSTLPNWYSEFRRFSPEVPVILYHGSKDERTTLRKKICKAVEIHKNSRVFPVVITSYEVTMNDRKYLQNHSWKYLIVDEGHRIKNTHCRLIGALRMYKSTHRLLLTGTPLQNNLSELWSLLNFLLPEIFDDLGSFESWFDIERMQSCHDADEQIVAHEQKNSILSMLHQILTPFMLRRLKADVSLSIPPKKEVLVYAPLTALQQEYYKSTVDKTVLNMIEQKKNTTPKVELNEKGRPMRRTTKSRVNYASMFSVGDEDDEKKKWSEKEEEKLDEWVKDVTSMQESRKTLSKDPEERKTSVVNIRLQNIMMQLRKCCNHPYLLEYPLLPETGQFRVDEQLVAASGKMMLLDKLLKELRTRGHKVLLFSQMTKMLDVVEDFCYLRKYQYCRLDGSYKIEERQKEIASFNSNPDVFLFLLSTRAGGLGINLTAADTVIIYDSDWNPQSDLQAQDRCHRIGQTKPVVVYRLVTSNSIDQRIVERAAAKRKLEKMVIHKGKFKSGIDSFTTSLTPLSGQELMTLLKSRDHESVVRGSEIISDAEVDMLLDRSDLMKKWSEMRRDKGVPEKTETKAKNRKKETSLFKIIDNGDTHVVRKETKSSVES